MITVSEMKNKFSMCQSCFDDYKKRNPIDKIKAIEIKLNIDGNSQSFHLCESCCCIMSDRLLNEVYNKQKA